MSVVPIMLFLKGNNMSWIWEPRGEGEFQTPEVSSIYEGWNGWDADLATTISSHSEVFTREITQNFVDASRLVQAHRVKSPTLTFRFIKFSGTQAEFIRGKLGVASLSKVYNDLDDSQRRSLKLPDSQLLGANSKDLTLLVVSETGTSGMLGTWARDDRHLDSDGKLIRRRMRDALLSSAGSNSKGSLGSYGEGKRAIIASSSPRSLFTYTAFDSGTTEDGVSRRLLGTTYWRPFNAAAKAFSGLALFGNQTDQSKRPEPFTDADADSFVQDLGIPGFSVRDAENPDDWGTSQIFLEPVVSADEVRESIERNWWPLLLDESASFEVIDYEGNSLVVDPSQRDYLAPFLKGWELIRGKSQPEAEFELLKNVELPKVGAVGTLSLLMDLSDSGFSRRDPESNRSIVALIRDGMIISYQKFPKNRNLPEPFVRGTYEVGSGNDFEISELLRQVEPPLHNYWNVKHEAMEKTALNLAQGIYDSISQSVKEFRAQFVEDMVKQSVDLPLFDEMLSVAGGQRTKRSVGPTPPPPPKSDWVILDDGAEVKEFDENTRWAIASRSVTLKADRLEQKLEIRYGWRVEGDSGKLEEEPSLFRKTDFVSRGFKSQDPGVAVGILKPGQSLTIKWSSNPYSELWTLQPFVQVTKLEVNDENTITAEIEESNDN